MHLGGSARSQVRSERRAPHVQWHLRRVAPPVLYVTERCVFRLSEAGLELTEIAPGVDLERDILALMDFRPIMTGPPRLMDARIFRPEPMDLRTELLALPMEKRFSYDSRTTGSSSIWKVLR
jgi:propionate CoA-transferase